MDEAKAITPTDVLIKALEEIEAFDEVVVLCMAKDKAGSSLANVTTTRAVYIVEAHKAAWLRGYVGIHAAEDEEPDGA